MQAMIAEVTNTPWGERRPTCSSARRRRTRCAGSFDKQMHVSPFMPMEQSYEWTRERAGRAPRRLRSPTREGERAGLRRVAGAAPPRARPGGDSPASCSATRRSRCRRSRGSTGTRLKLKLQGRPVPPAPAGGARSSPSPARIVHRVLRRDPRRADRARRGLAGRARYGFGPPAAPLRAESTVHDPRFYGARPAPIAASPSAQLRRRALGQPTTSPACCGSSPATSAAPTRCAPASPRCRSRPSGSRR